MASARTSLATVTFGDVAENHARMQKIGKLHERGYSVGELHLLSTKLETLGLKTEYISLNEEFKDDASFAEAGVLVIRKAAQFIIGEPTTQLLQDEHSKLEVDKKAFMRGRVVNKHARWNLCFDDEDQEPNYEEGKGRIVSYKHLPITQRMRETIADWTNDVLLKGEANYYYDLLKCGIGYHGDAERRKVFAVRFGASEKAPLYYQWYQNSKPVGNRIEIIVEDGDMYVMSEKAVGFDWMKKKVPTLRHATGCGKYTTVVKK